MKKGMKIAVLGAGRSGKSAALLAQKQGHHVTCFDSNTEIPKDWNPDICLKTGASEEDGRAYTADLVIISPGIEADCPFTLAFLEAGASLIGEIEYAYSLYKGRIIAITGTNGKTTTTSLLEKIFQQAGWKAVACGNYGLPMAEAIMQEPCPELLILELSSFQLETIKNFRAEVAIWLNFAPDHMDRYKCVDDYYQAKLRIFDNMHPEDHAIVRVAELLPSIKPSIQTFSSESREGDLSFVSGWIEEDSKKLLDLRGTRMDQAHNAENVMASILAARVFGISIDQVAQTLQEFSPPGHRCQYVAEQGGILWLNDSKSTNLHSTEAALKSQTRPVVLIVGGKDKGLDYTPLLPLLKSKLRACIVFGQISDQLYDCFSSTVLTVRGTDLTDVVAHAQALAQEGDVVLFSPGTSSFDMFTGYVQRGQIFRDAVLQSLNQ